MHTKESQSQGVTVVVCTLNRGGFLRDCLHDLLAQDHRPLEILVVDQSETIPEPVATLSEANPEIITYHRVRFRGLPQARNYGWQQARYEAIVYVDDDIRCGPTLVSEHLRCLQQPGVGVVGGGIDEVHHPNITTTPTGRFNRWTGTPKGGFAAHGEQEGLDHVKGGNWSVWRHVMVAVGGIDEQLNIGAALYEELECCLRIRAAGWRIHFNGDARLTHLAAPSGGCRVEQVLPYVRSLAHNRGVLIRRHIAWYQAPVAMGRVMLFGVSFLRSSRKPTALMEAARGIVQGWRTGSRSPQCTSFGSEHRR